VVVVDMGRNCTLWGVVEARIKEVVLRLEGLLLVELAAESARREHMGRGDGVSLVRPDAMGLQIARHRSPALLEAVLESPLGMSRLHGTRERRLNMSMRAGRRPGGCWRQWTARCRSPSLRQIRMYCFQAS